MSSCVLKVVMSWWVEWAIEVRDDGLLGWVSPPKDVLSSWLSSGMSSRVVCGFACDGDEGGGVTSTASVSLGVDAA